MKLIYIASPYTNGDQAANVRVQLDAAHRIMDLGHCPVAPLLTHYMQIHRDRPYEEWMLMDFALILRCDYLLRLPGESPGADRETIFAKQHDIPVIFGWGHLDYFLATIV